MFKKLSLRISFTLILILGIIVGVFTIYLIRDRSNQLRDTILDKGIVTAQTGAKIMGSVLEDVVENGVFSLTELFNDSLVKIPIDSAILEKYSEISDEQLADIQKYHYSTGLDTHLDTVIARIQDEFFKDPQVVFAVLCDRQGYTPTHNAKYDKSLVGDLHIDIEESRSKRIFYDSTVVNGLDKDYVLKVYSRDTGEEMWRIISPVYVKNKFWGTFRIGFSMRKTAEAIDKLKTRLVIMMGVLLLITFIAINSATSLLMKPLEKLYHGVSKVSEGDLTYNIELNRSDELGKLAKAFNKMNKDLKDYILNLQETTATKERIQGELKVGKDIQKRMLPHEFPAFPERKDIDIYAIMEPAKEVAGDYYDFFFIDKDNLCIVISDVSGKGVPAALFMVVAKTLVELEAQRGLAVKDVLFNVNNALCMNNETAMFATMFCAILNTKTGGLSVVNAGHNPPLIGNAESGYSFMDLEQNIALGIMDDFAFQSEDLKMNKGDRIILYTDGITEAFDTNGDVFSEDRLVSSVEKNSESDNKHLITEMRNDISIFTKGEAQSDDITILALSFLDA